MIVPLFVGSGKRCVAVLTPHEKNEIFKNLNMEYKLRANFFLHTAMRISECEYVRANPSSFRKENGAIFLPNVGEGKHRCTIKNRAVLLSKAGIGAVEAFLASGVGIPTYQSMEPAFKRAALDAGFDTRYITTKMFRKTMISWLMACFPERQASIALSAGHNYVTMQGHYLTQGWRKEDVKEMRDELRGWGEN
jgi:integrase